MIDREELIYGPYAEVRGEFLQKDPVCGMMVDEKKSKLTSTADGKTFYFCSTTCKATFDRDPHRYGHK